MRILIKALLWIECIFVLIPASLFLSLPIYDVFPAVLFLGPGKTFEYFILWGLVFWGVVALWKMFIYQVKSVSPLPKLPIFGFAAGIIGLILIFIEYAALYIASRTMITITEIFFNIDTIMLLIIFLSIAIGFRWIYILSRNKNLK